MRYFFENFLKNESGQSLVEIMIGLAIGAILIGSATFGVTFILRSSTTNQNLTAASSLTEGLLEKVRSFGNASWQNIYNLQKGSSNKYFLAASGTSLFAIQGKEGIIDNDVTRGLVGEWEFDEDASATSTTTYDTSGNGNNGTLYGSPARASSTCKIANCITFGGSSYAQVSDPSGAFDLNAYTWTAWAKPTWASGTPAYNPAVMALRNTLTTRMSMHIRSDYSDLDLWNGTSVQPFPYTFQQNTWYHIVLTYASGVASVYVNGARVNGVSYAQGGAANLPLNIGSSNGTTEYFTGTIDDVRIYNRALSADEISQLYKAGIYDRYFYAENVCRTNDASSSISGISPCATGYEDPLTQKITAVAEWQANATTTQFTLSSYLTRWKNFSLEQTDWSGGSGQTGVFPVPDNTYASGTNITATPPGSFQIQNLTQQ